MEIDDLQTNEQLVYWAGWYEACRMLDTSPRMNRAQREIIQEQAYKAADRLRALGVTFTDNAAEGLSILP